MTKDDDDLDDAMGSLRSMRSVWRDMREEEPPSRGFAELMAAARVKAETMQPEKAESWWRRGFAMLVRPPMLAAATVVVLVGGAVVLSKRGVDTPTASTTTDSLQAERGEEAMRAKQGGQDAKPVAPPAVAEPSNAAGPADKAQPPSPVRRPRPAPGIVRETTKEHGGAARADANAQPSKPAADKGDGLHIAGETEGDVESGPKKATERRPPEPTGRPAAGDSVIATEDVPAVRPTQRPTQPPIEQLINQTETAAKRKDCAAVKVTAARIRKLDGAVYKSRVVTQPAIARCLK